MNLFSPPHHTIVPGRSCGTAAVVLLTLAAPLSAQQTQPTTAPLRRNGNNAAAHVTTAPGGGLILNFKDASIDSVLDELSAVAGFIVVKIDKPEGRVTLESKRPVSAEDAVSLLNTVLKNNNYAAIQQGRILKIINRDKAKHANIPVHSGADPTKIEPTDELITQVIPLKYADATQLKQDLTPLISPEADFTANQSSNALVMTDTAANIRRLVEIVSALDTHLADSADVKVFQLKYATAASAARLINDLFGDASRGSRSGQSSDQFPRFGFFGGGFPGFPGSSSSSSSGGGSDRGDRGDRSSRGGQAATGRNAIRINASSDDRTNTVVVTGPPETLAVIEKVVKDLDANPASEETVFIYHLRNAQALNVQDVINYLFNSTGGVTARTNVSGGSNTRSGYGGLGSNSGRSGFGGLGSGGSSGSSLGGGSSGRFGSSSLGSTGFGSSGSSGSPFGSSGSSGFSSRFGGSSGFGGFGGISSSTAQAASALAGQVNIIADPDTNSLLVRTSPKNYEIVQAVLMELDRPVPQVLIKVLVAEVTHTNDTDLGVELSALNLCASGLGQSAGTNFGLADQTSGLIAKVLESDFTATVRILETVGKIDVLSRPYILASDNQLASIIVGQTVPIPTNSRVTDTGQTINSVEYTDIGIILNVTPHINPDGLVILDVNPEISSLSGSSVPTGPGTNAPIFNKRSAQSRVAILDGKTIVIGGLMEDRKTQTQNKIPLLGDIPILGALFQRNIVGKSKTELLIFLTPHVASSPEVLQGMSNDEMKGTKLTPKAVQPGAFDEHMRGMQRGAAATQPATTRPMYPMPPIGNPDDSRNLSPSSPSPGTPGEGRGEGASPPLPPGEGRGEGGRNRPAPAEDSR